MYGLENVYSSFRMDLDDKGRHIPLKSFQRGCPLDGFGVSLHYSGTSAGQGTLSVPKIPDIPTSSAFYAFAHGCRLVPNEPAGSNFQFLLMRFSF